MTQYISGVVNEPPINESLKHLAGYSTIISLLVKFRGQAGYVRDLILEFRPRRILEAGIVEGENFPEEEFRKPTNSMHKWMVYGF